jgi:hypothetical protein
MHLLASRYDGRDLDSLPFSWPPTKLGLNRKKWPKYSANWGRGIREGKATLLDLIRTSCRLQRLCRTWLACRREELELRYGFKTLTIIQIPATTRVTAVPDTTVTAQMASESMSRYLLRLQEITLFKVSLFRHQYLLHRPFHPILSRATAIC